VFQSVAERYGVNQRYLTAVHFTPVAELAYACVLDFNSLWDPFDRQRVYGLSDFYARHAVLANVSYSVLFRAGSKAVGAVVNGWTLDGIVTLQLGMPFTPRLNARVSRDGNLTLILARCQPPESRTLPPGA